MYWIINKNTREVIRRSATPFNVDETVQPPAPYLQLKQVNDDTQPAFDPATEKLERFFTDDDEAFTRTFAFQVVPMTQDEIDAYQRRQQDAAELEQLKLVYQALKDGTGTSAERIRRVERVCAWLLKDHARENFG